MPACSVIVLLMHRNLITTPIFLHNPNVSQRPFSSTILGVIDQNSGTYFDYWDSPVVIRLAEELQKVLPEVLAGHELSHAWMYLYDSEVHDEVLVAERQPNGTFLAGEHGAGSGGIPEHADQAAVNVNIWLTPDRFNGDLGSGGWRFRPLPPARMEFSRHESAYGPHHKPPPRPGRKGRPRLRTSLAIREDTVSPEPYG